MTLSLTTQDLERAAIEIAQCLKQIYDDPDELERLFSGQRRPQGRVIRQVAGSSGSLIALVAFRQVGATRLDQLLLSISKDTEATEVDYRRERIPTGSEGIHILRRSAEARKATRQPEEVFRCNVLLPGSVSPLQPPPRPLEPVCPGCGLVFWRLPSLPDQQYCCSRCEQEKAKTTPHDKECRRFIPWKMRRLRQGLGDGAPGMQLDLTDNLVAGDEVAESIFLQLAIYAARTGQLSHDQESEVVRRFYDHFKKDVGMINPGRLQGSSPEAVRYDIFSEAWQAIRKNYRIPDRADGFTHYVRHTLRLLAQAPLTKNSFPMGSSPPEMPTPQEAAAYVGISLSTLYNLISRRVVRTSGLGHGSTLQPGWWETLQAWKQAEAQRQERIEEGQVLARSLQKKQNIEYKSALRNVNRWREAGLSPAEILARIGVDVAALRAQDDEK